MSGSRDEECAQNRLTIDIAQGFGTGAFRMGHHSKHIAFLITDAGDIPERSIRIRGRNDMAALVGVAIDHLVIPLQLVKGPVIGVISAFAMSDGYLEGFPLIAGAAHVNIRGDELLVGVAEQCARQEMGFAEDLETVADPEDLTAFGCKTRYALHNRTESGNSPASEIIAIRKTARQYDAVVFGETAQARILMPQHDNLLIQIVLQGVL